MLFKVISWHLHGIDVFKNFIFRAIELDGRNAVYFCNRAAAHSKLNQHQFAIDDCKKAITIDPLYSKAYGRMG
jgi:small glutamine-rich tetratricopeptide repeat-containing protein alpha